MNLAIVEHERGLLDNIERFYLRALRVIILLLATAMVVIAAWLAVTSLIKIGRSASSVTEQTATVSAEDIADAALTKKVALSTGKMLPPKGQVNYINSFLDRYYSLYKSGFDSFRHPEDKSLSKEDFDALFVHSSDRIENLAAPNSDFQSEKADLEGLLRVMTEVSQKTTTRNALARYKNARKINVTRTVQKFRVESRKGWDSMSESCASWYESPIGCPVTRYVSVPYNEKATVMEYPAGIFSPVDLFQSFQQRYVDLLVLRRDENARDADRKREDIINGNAAGRVSLMTALELVAVFVILMFFFLLIAIERHQRRLAAALPVLAVDER